MKNRFHTIIITKLWPMKFVMEWGMQKHNKVFITNLFLFNGLLKRLEFLFMTYLREIL